MILQCLNITVRTGGMIEMASIRVSESTRIGLNDLKIHPRETYGDVIERLIEKAKESD